MTKKFKSGKCAHCLSFSRKLTSDHVFPKSWYPSTTPSNIEKWQMPSCTKCNKEFGIIENELLIKFGLCVDPLEFSALGIADKALRALNPAFGKDEKDIKARLRKREKILKEMFPYSSEFNNATLPGFGLKDNLHLIPPTCIGIEPDKIIEVGKKIIRGTQYVLWKRLIPKEMIIDVVFVQEPVSIPIQQLISKFGVKYHRGPGIVVGIVMPKDESFSALYEIIIWGRLKIYGSILPIQQLL